jgi:hypothetical protein
MAHNNYRPDFGYLLKLGFVETNDGRNHPYNRSLELQLSESVKMEMNAVWDFEVAIKGINYIPILFSDNDDLESFIETFKMK